MKKILLALLVLSLAGCVVAPIPRARMVVDPSIEIVYSWDPYLGRYYYEDAGRRYYQPPGWQRQNDREHGRGHGRGHDRDR